MKLQHIAAAVALVAAGTANAAIATGGNGSLVLIAYDKSPVGSFNNVAGMFDLGITLDDLVGATGNGTALATGLHSKNLSWDLDSNTFTIDGVASTAYGTNSWAAAWSTLTSNVDASNFSYVVTAFDTVGFGAAVRSIVTGKVDSTANFNTTQAVAMNAIAAGKPNDIFTPQNGQTVGSTVFPAKGTHGTAANGAYTFTPADGATTRANGYAMAGDGFGNEWRSANVLQGETLVGNTTGLYMVDGAAKKLRLGAGTPGNGLVSLNAATGTLSYMGSTMPVTPAIPEPSTYALAIAGLAIAGVAARRRRAA
jgi:PEP-CTERM motif